MTDILRLGIFTGLQKLRRQRRADRFEEEDRTRRRSLDDLVRKNRESEAARDAALDDMRLRSGGYVPAGEATGDPNPVVASEQTLEDVLRATMDSPGVKMPQALDQRVERYGTEVGGYRHDQFSEAARAGRARTRRAEQLASPRREEEDEPKAPSFAERRQKSLEARIAELVESGVPLDAANRQARMEVGGSVSLESRVGAGSESPVVRDGRRNADRDLKLLNTTERKIRDLRRELGSANLQSPRPEDRPKIAELKRLQATADSLRSSAFKHSAQASTGSASSQRTIDASTPLQRELVRARQLYDQAIARPGADTARARELYQRVVAGIMAKHKGGSQ